jgi:cephalosporin hydroxylase
MVETFQNPWELEKLVELFDGISPVTVLEVGAWHGGTLKQWIGLGRSIVVVDDEMRNSAEWAEWAEKAQCELTLLQGISQDESIVSRARELGPYDFCFIDADHRFDQVLADWQNYGPMADVVAFHDIIPRPGYGVSAVWESIKQTPGARWMEINETVEAENESRCGIGVVWQRSR